MSEPRPASPSTASGSKTLRAESAKYGTACVRCRQKKQKCDAAIPACARCQKMGEQCVYQTASRKHDARTLLAALSTALQFLQSLETSPLTTSTEDMRRRIRHFLADNSLEENLAAQQDVEGEDVPTDLVDWLNNEDTPPAGRMTDTSFQPDAAQTAGAGPSTHSALVQHVSALPDGYRPERAADEASVMDQVDEMLMHMSLADNGQNRHFGVSSLFWQSPSNTVVERLERRMARSQRAQSFGRSPSTKRPPAAPTAAHTERRDHLELPEWWMTHRDEERWATDDSRLRGSYGAEDANILKSNASLVAGWENVAFHKMELEVGAAQANLVRKLLQAYFCWEYSTHSIVYRPVFTRDMALGGPYFNDFLLNAICAHAVRLLDSSEGIDTHGLAENWMTKARQSLAIEMELASSVPTCQGLLILGQRECAYGNPTQGWMYTGMAFRAMRDMGVHLDCNRLPIFGFGTLSLEDQEIRRRLFWSAYTWDKVISVTLGRAPTFNAFQMVSPGLTMDDTEDQVLWEPTSPSSATVPIPQKAFITSTFRHFTKLCEAIQKIVLRLYDGRNLRQSSGQFVTRMSGYLRTWYEQLPAELKLEPSSPPSGSGAPLHIFSLNIMYRATWILLYRIFLPKAMLSRSIVDPDVARSAEVTCAVMAEDIHQLLKLYIQSYPLERLNYEIGWAVVSNEWYSAAVINAMDFSSANLAVSTGAQIRLSMSLHVLEKLGSNMPGVQRSIGIIKQRLRAPSAYQAPQHKRVHDEDTSEPPSRDPPVPEAATTSNQADQTVLAAHLTRLPDSIPQGQGTGQLDQWLAQQNFVDHHQQPALSAFAPTRGELPALLNPNVGHEEGILDMGDQGLYSILDKMLGPGATDPNTNTTNTAETGYVWDWMNNRDPDQFQG